MTCTDTLPGWCDPPPPAARYLGATTPPPPRCRPNCFRWWPFLMGEQRCHTGPVDGSLAA